MTPEEPVRKQRISARAAAPASVTVRGSAARPGVLHRLQRSRHLDPARRRDRPRRAPGGLVAPRGPRGDRAHHRGPPHPRSRVAALHRAFAARGDRGLPRRRTWCTTPRSARRRTSHASSRSTAPPTRSPGCAWTTYGPAGLEAAAVVIEALGWTDACRVLERVATCCNLDYMITETAEASAITAWFTGRLPEAWKPAAPSVTVDREEITVRITIDPVQLGDDASEADRGRSRRRPGVRLARADPRRADRDRPRGRGPVRAEGLLGRRRRGRPDASALFTHLAVPVMTRLRQPQRLVLDTLVEAGVARSRADALAWCVRLVGQHSEEWLERAARVPSKGSRRSATAAPQHDPRRDCGKGRVR